MSILEVRYPKKQKPHYNNPLQKAVHSFLKQHTSGARFPQEEESVDVVVLTNSIPKRYTIYPPLLLLPRNIFSAPKWASFISTLSTPDLQALYKTIADAFKPQGITHLALNSPISPATPNSVSNVTRSPTNLTPLYGDFGPKNLLGQSGFPCGKPAEDDLSAALWVHTTQNGGIFQTWAPLWTMFSRGNISEKARILGSHSVFEGLDGVDGLLGQYLSEIAVVDMYVGIGYFAFSYLKMGVGRVFGWELNGWSVEGLRRGCLKNGWGVRVLRIGDDGEAGDDKGRAGDEAVRRLVEELDCNRDIRMIVFHGDNRWAKKVLGTIKNLSGRVMESGGSISRLDVRHVNLGLLPTSRLSWQDAIGILGRERGGWIHVHENVNVQEMKQTRKFIVEQFQAHIRGSSSVSCSHIEQVKTYAPGVMHCVFDMHIQPSSVPPNAIENG
jgi:tRNA wybutosine-synthesizing protein 2